MILGLKEIRKFQVPVWNRTHSLCDTNRYSNAGKTQYPLHHMASHSLNLDTALTGCEFDSTQLGPPNIPIRQQ